MRTAHRAVIVALLRASLAGCSAVLAVQENGRQFHPYVADVNPPFRFIDNRLTASRTSHLIDRGDGISAWIYGDEQFSPGLAQVVADRFAKMFPAAGQDAELVIAELEIYYELATFGNIPRECSLSGPGRLLLWTLPMCIWWQPIYQALHTRGNSVNARLSGKFDGVAFDVGHTAEFKYNAPDQEERRVLTALQAVIDKALTAVVERLNVARPGPPDPNHKANPEPHRATAL
jgi:hypothetical protein